MSFAAGVNNGYEHLLELSYRWHMDHPAGEVISSLGNFSWAFAEMVDVASWGLLPVVVVVLSAIGVLAVVAWPAALALLVMVGGFVVVLIPAPSAGARRLPGLRGPPLQGHRRGGRHGDQPDGRPDRGRRAPREAPGRGPDAPVGRRRPPGPVHLHAHPAPAGDLHRGRHPAGPGGRHDHGRAPLGLDGRALPDPLLLGPGGPEPPAVLRAPAVLRPVAGAGGQVHRHRRRARSRSPTRPARRSLAVPRGEGRLPAVSTSATGRARPCSTT